jgi:His-Xaa-Ser system protein HxsD
MEPLPIPGGVDVAEGRVQVQLDLRVYRLSAIKAAAYRIADRCAVSLDAPDGDTILVTLLFRRQVTEVAARDALLAFHQEVLDQELREQLREETEPVRALILAQAFSRTDIIKRS